MRNMGHFSQSEAKEEFYGLRKKRGFVTLMLLQ
jgi:hypothetical protein